MIDVEVPKIEKKPVIVSGNWQFGGWLKPLLIDTEHVSVEFLETLGKQGVIISNKAGSVNLNEIADTVRYLTDGISKYDKYDYSIVECLLADGTEIEFPDYTNFDGLRAWPVMEIKNTAFRNIRFTGDFVMNNLEVVNNGEFLKSIFDGIFEGEKIKIFGNRAFHDSNFSGSLNLPVCEYIGIEAFYFSNFSGSLSLPVCVEVKDSAFRNSNFSGSLNLPVCTFIGNNAFYYSNFSGSLSLPACEYIGGYAFRNSNFSGSLKLQVCTYIGGYAFRNSNFSGSLDLPLCTYIGYNAFTNSNFNSITIGANAVLGVDCIGAHSQEFIDDYTANGKLAGTYIWDGQHWIYKE